MKTTLLSINYIRRSVTLSVLLFFSLLIAGFGLLSKVEAVNPPPDGGYFGGNTAEGNEALLSLTTGTYNTGVGWFTLKSNTGASFNTATGAGALLVNTADQNTATGAGALLSNGIGVNNTANGAFALFGNTEGSFNTAAGDEALFSNTTGTVNTAMGAGALTNNTTGHHNTAIGGDFVLFSNTTGTFNTAVGVDSLAFNTTGSQNTGNGAFALSINTADGNTAIGFAALSNSTTGAQNTAVGYAALVSNTTAGANTNGANTAVGAFALQSNTTSGANTALGYAALGNVTTNGGNTAIGDLAGFNVTGSQNICIGSGVGGFAGDNNTIRIGSNLPDTQGDSACYIGGIVNQLSGGSPVLINVSGKLGTSASSKRFKQDISPMDRASEVLFALNPVTFRYKKEIDPEGLHQFGLVAEQVQKVDPDLVVRDKEGKPYSVRYDQVNAMLLNEFLKEHKKVQGQQATTAELKKEIAALTATIKEQAAQIKKVSVQLEVGKAATKVVVNKP